MSLSLLALLSQMLLPAAHAQGMARRSGDPQQLVFCGGSAALLSALRRTVAVELVAALEVSPDRSDEACVHAAIVGTLFVPPSAPGLPHWAGLRQVLSAPPLTQSALPLRTRPPQARAPPQLREVEFHARLS